MDYSVEFRKSSMPMADFRRRYQDRAKFIAYCRECPRYDTVLSGKPSTVMGVRKLASGWGEIDAGKNVLGIMPAGNFPVHGMYICKNCCAGGGKGEYRHDG